MSRPIFLLLLILASHLPMTTPLPGPSGIVRASDLPSLGEGSSVVSPSQERALGESWLRRLRSQVPMMDDPLLQEYLDDLVYRLVPNSALSDRRLTLTVIDSPELNAFAVPGGVIGINAGLLLYTDNEQELASVVAHEIAHLSQRHFARRLEESSKQMALSMAGFLASVIVAATAGSDAGIAAMASTQALSLQQQLSYSRQNEQEADRLGLQTLTDTGMNPQAMVSMFERMMRSQRYNRSVPEYLRTHPLTESRVSDMAARAAELAAPPYRENPDFYYMQSRIRVHYNASSVDLANQFRSQQQSIREEVRLAGLYGEALSLIRQGRAADADEALNALVTADPNRLSIAYLRAESLMAREQTTAALQLLQSTLERNPGNFALSRRLAEALVQEKRYKDAERVLRDLTVSHPDDIHLWYDLAEVAGQAGSIVELHRARAEYFYLRADLKAARQQLEQALAKSEGNYQQSVLIRDRLKALEGTGEVFTF